MAENEQQSRPTQGEEEKEREEERRSEEEEEEEEPFSPLPESAEQVSPCFFLIEHPLTELQVADLLEKVENYTTAIPDSVTESVLNSAGLQSTDPQVAKAIHIREACPYQNG